VEAMRQGATRRGGRAGGRRRALTRALLPLVATLLLALAGCGIGGPGASDLAAAPTAPPATATPTLPAIAPPRLDSHVKAYVFDPATGRAYLNVDADHPVAMASTTKIMTAIAALTYGKEDQVIAIGLDATAENNGENSVAGVRLGEKFALKELIYGLLLPSGDDVAVAIADGVAGSQANFVALMNVEAAVLGLRSTHYTNVHGLDDPNKAHLSSAHDLAILTQSAMNFQVIRDAVGRTSWTDPQTATHKAYTWTNTNLLLDSKQRFYFANTLGVKTGYTGDAGYCLVFMAQRDGRALIGAVLDEQDANARFADAIALLNWGFQVQQRLAA